MGPEIAGGAVPPGRSLRHFAASAFAKHCDFGIPIVSFGKYGAMKATIEIHDELLMRAKRHAQRTGRPLSAVVEDGLRRVLDAPPTLSRYVLPDLRIGDPNSPDPLEECTWPDLCALIYERRRSR